LKFHRLIPGFSLVLCFFLAALPQLNAQSKEDLEKERMKIIQQIEKTSKLLDKTSKDKRSALTDLQLLQGQIDNRKKVIANIRNSLSIAEQQLQEESKRQDQLGHKYLELKRDRDMLLRMNHIKMLTENKLIYFLSSQNWEQSLARLRYSKQLESYLVRQMDSLENTNIALENSIAQIESDRRQYEELLEEEEANIRDLEKDEARKDRLLAQLQGDEKRLRGALIKQRKDREELNKAIEKIILASLNNKKNDKDDRNFALSGAFSEQKRKLPWPVGNARVISKYGKQKHPTLDNVFISNNGIDIFSNKNASVQAIFQGEVAGALQIPGNDYMIMIKHGNYYTVYSKLIEVYVAKGERIAAGHTIGKLGPNNATLHFEIWKDKEKLDPEQWLR
jgi:septal ring factor EnvC (AmiA/AmiB activator)